MTDKKQKILEMVMKIVIVILVIIGILFFTVELQRYKKEIQNQEENKQQNDSSQSQNDSNINKNVILSDPDVSSNLAIDFQLKTLDGQTLQLSQYRGKVVFLNFLATWCKPCNQELEIIEKLYQEYGNNQGEVIFLGVVNPKVDDKEAVDKTIEEVNQFFSERDIKIPILLDETKEVYQAYNIKHYPTSFLINQEGEIIDSFGLATKKEIENKIETVLSNKGGKDGTY